MLSYHLQGIRRFCSRRGTAGETGNEYHTRRTWPSLPRYGKWSSAPKTKTMEFSHPTPLFPHIKHQAYRDVYEPAEDSFLFMDALELETSFINQLKYTFVARCAYLHSSTCYRPAVCLELGSGSGAVLTFLAKLLCSPAFLW